VAERVLGVLRELERADEEIGAVLADLDRLAEELDVLRTRVADLRAFEERLPSECERLAADLERTRAEADSAREALGKAKEAVRTAKPGAAREAELFEVRARDGVTSADRRCREAEARVAALEREAREAQYEAGELHAKAQAIAGELAERPRLAQDAGREPGVGLDGVAAWSEVARASLFVARGQVTAEREAVIRQANELGAVVLGEPLTSASAAVVTRRVEQALPK
jgi:chromosome segregation ATPase